MKSIAAAAVLFAGLTVAQDITALNNLPACGVSADREFLIKATTR